jgi:hypothetical protein
MGAGYADFVMVSTKPWYLTSDAMASIKLPATSLKYFTPSRSRIVSSVFSIASRKAASSSWYLSSCQRVFLRQFRQMATAVIKPIHVIFDKMTAIGFDNGFTLGFGGGSGWHSDLPVFGASIAQMVGIGTDIMISLDHLDELDRLVIAACKKGMQSERFVSELQDAMRRVRRYCLKKPIIYWMPITF